MSRRKRRRIGPQLADMVSWHYHQHIGNLRKIAKAHGYALATHGSLARDIDLIAIPWVKDAQPPRLLAEAIRDAVQGTFSGSLGFDSAEGCPGSKPHGRLGWCINFGDGVYIDLAVMPPKAAEAAKGTQ